MSAFICLK
jgi:hypothetical protein